MGRSMLLRPEREEMPSPIIITLTPAVTVQLTPPAAKDLLRQLQAALPGSNAAPVDTAIGTTQVLDDDHPLWDRHSGGSGHQGQEWTLADLAEAEAFYASVQGKAKPLFDLLIDRPGQPLDTEEIIEILPDLFQNSRSIAGALNGLRLAKEASGRRYPFYWWAGNPTRYAMKPSVAEVFRQARRKFGG
jgi:Family of unknown function (DUF6416)